LEHLAARPFSFYPPILNIEHNEWLFRKAAWSEILVVNCKTQTEIWIPRRFIGEVSRVDDPVLIVGLTKELEYRGGAVWPYQKRVLQMPVAVGSASAVPVADDRPSPAPVVGIRLESSDRRAVKLIGGALAVAVLLSLGAVNLFRLGDIRQKRVVFTTRDQSYLELTPRDDYLDVVQKLGRPQDERWNSEGAEIQYRALGYPQRKFTVILMGSDRQTAKYIGTVDENWAPLHSVALPSGGTTTSLLRSLKRF
jgi:hypothetical protein